MRHKLTLSRASDMPKSGHEAVRLATVCADSQWRALPSSGRADDDILHRAG